MGARPRFLGERTEGMSKVILIANWVGLGLICVFGLSGIFQVVVELIRDRRQRTVFQLLRRREAHR